MKKLLKSLRNRLRSNLLPHTPQTISPEASFPIAKFWETSFVENTVQLALRDCCKPGSTVFDVGANNGGLSTIMSRLVGPHGTVLAFEASKRIIDKTNYNLNNSGCNNIQLFHRAVYHTSGKLIPIYLGTHLNDSIYNHQWMSGSVGENVESIALDDLIEESQLHPNLIKMDIEGAELDALKGMKRTLKENPPVLILEQSPNDLQCLELLKDYGYIAVDLSTYKRIENADDFDPNTPIANLIFVHRQSDPNNPYLRNLTSEKISDLCSDDFETTDKGITQKESLQLPPGRYTCHLKFSAEGTDNATYGFIDSDNGRIVRYEAYSKLLAASYKQWTFHLQYPSKINIGLHVHHGSDSTLKCDGAEIRYFPELSNLPRRYLY